MCVFVLFVFCFFASFFFFFFFFFFGGGGGCTPIIFPKLNNNMPFKSEIDSSLMYITALKVDELASAISHNSKPEAISTPVTMLTQVKLTVSQGKQ